MSDILYVAPMAITELLTDEFEPMIKSVVEIVPPEMLDNASLLPVTQELPKYVSDEETLLNKNFSIGLFASVAVPTEFVANDAL